MGLSALEGADARGKRSPRTQLLRKRVDFQQTGSAVLVQRFLNISCHLFLMLPDLASRLPGFSCLSGEGAVLDLFPLTADPFLARSPLSCHLGGPPSLGSPSGDGRRSFKGRPMLPFSIVSVPLKEGTDFGTRSHLHTHGLRGREGGRRGPRSCTLPSHPFAKRDLHNGPLMTVAAAVAQSL